MLTLRVSIAACRDYSGRASEIVLAFRLTDLKDGKTQCGLTGVEHVIRWEFFVSSAHAERVLALSVRTLRGLYPL